MSLAITRRLLPICLLLAAAPTVSADYTRGGSLLSWQWLTDISETIVVGRVTKVDVSGGFQLRVDTLLKQGERSLSVGDIVSGPVLGHAIPYLENVGDPSVARELGWPVLSDKSTYPTRQRTNLPTWNPTLRRQADWHLNDRCIVFYGDNQKSPLQIINLDKPMVIEVPFLTVDQRGKAVDDPEQLIASIRKRIAPPDPALQDAAPQAAAERQPKQTHRRFGGTFHYDVWRSDLDGADYYGILVPANEPEIADRFAERLSRTTPPSGNMKDAVWGAGESSALGAWKYWFGSDRQASDFSKDAVHERRFAIEYLLSIRPNFTKEYLGWSSRYPTKGSFQDQNRLYDRLRHHLVSHRTFPLGWNTLLSNDGHRFAFTDANSLYLHEVDQRERRCGLRLHQNRKCDIIHSKMQFSNDNRYLAYNQSDGSLCVVDALNGKLLWNSEPPQMTRTKHTHPDSQIFGASVHFSHDSRYVAQHLFIDHRPTVQKKNGGSVYHCRSKIIVWDVDTGKRLFAPYADFTPNLMFHSFDPANSDHLRTRVQMDSHLWSVAKGERVEAGSRE